MAAATEEHPVDAWDKVMNLNIRSLFLLSQRIGKLSMIPNKYGRIINLASIAGLRSAAGNIQMIAYHTSKGAVVNFTLGPPRHYGQCACAGILSIQNDGGDDRGSR